MNFDGSYGGVGYPHHHTCRRKFFILDFRDSPNFCFVTHLLVEADLFLPQMMENNTPHLLDVAGEYRL